MVRTTRRSSSRSTSSAFERGTTSSSSPFRARGKPPGGAEPAGNRGREETKSPLRSRGAREDRYRDAQEIEITDPVLEDPKKPAPGDSEGKRRRSTEGRGSAVGTGSSKTQGPILELPAFAVRLPDELVGLGTVRRLQVLRVPLELLAHPVRHEASRLCSMRAPE